MTENTSYNEEALLLRVAEGDETAFALIFHRYYNDLGHYIYAVTKSEELTAEVVQNTFLKIWMARESLSKISHFRSYLFTISRNAAISAFRNAVREQAHKRQWRQNNPEQAGAEPDWKEKEKYLTLIDQAIEALPPQRKKVYLLSRKDGLKYEEIARELGISKLTVRAHIRQATDAITAFVREKGNLLMLLYWLAESFLKNS